MRIQKDFTFEAAHRLATHKGLCRNLHGHSYKIRVEITNAQYDFEPKEVESGMVLDFGDFKKIMEPIIAELDHSLLLNRLSQDEVDLKLSKLEGLTKICWIEGPTTAENIATYLVMKVAEPLENENCYVEKITVWETSKNAVISNACY